MLLLLNCAKVCLHSICSQKHGNGRKSEEIGGFAISKVNLHIIQAFHKKESKFSSFQVRWQETIKFGSWTKYQMKDQKHGRQQETNRSVIQPTDRLAHLCKFQPIGISSNRSAGPSCHFQPIGAYPQPIGWNSRTEIARSFLPHSSPFFLVF